MSPTMELVDIVLYCVQQLGVMLGVGAQTILLIADLIAMRDGGVSKDEEKFLKAIQRVIYFSLFCIISSGALITFLHVGGGQMDIILQPAFLFKWALIAVVTVLAIVDGLSNFSLGMIKGVASGTWFALFLVHILAPVSTWPVLGLLYIVWMVGFVTFFSLVIFMLHGKTSAESPQPAQPIGTQPKPLPVQMPPPQRAPIVAAAPPPPPAPVVRQVFQPTPLVPPPLPVMQMPPAAIKPPPPPPPTFSIPTASEAFPYAGSRVGSSPVLHPHLTAERSGGMVSLPPPPAPVQGPSEALKAAGVTATLPALRIMPQKPEDLETQHRAPLVRFG